MQFVRFYTLVRPISRLPLSYRAPAAMAKSGPHRGLRASSAGTVCKASAGCHQWMAFPKTDSLSGKAKCCPPSPPAPWFTALVLWRPGRAGQGWVIKRPCHMPRVICLSTHCRHPGKLALIGPCTWLISPLGLL